MSVIQTINPVIEPATIDKQDAIPDLWALVPTAVAATATYAAVGRANGVIEFYSMRMVRFET